MSSDLLAEYDQGIDTLGDCRMKYYKWFSLFSFENGNEIHFGEGMSSFCSDRAHYDKLKDFVKEQKKWIRSDTPTKPQMAGRGWWFLQKLLEFGIFSASEFRTILLWFQSL